MYKKNNSKYCIILVRSVIWFFFMLSDYLQFLKILKLYIKLGTEKQYIKHLYQNLLVIICRLPSPGKELSQLKHHTELLLHL